MCYGKFCFTLSFMNHTCLFKCMTTSVTEGVDSVTMHRNASSASKLITIMATLPALCAYVYTHTHIYRHIQTHTCNPSNFITDYRVSWWRLRWEPKKRSPEMSVILQALLSRARTQNPTHTSPFWSQDVTLVSLSLLLNPNYYPEEYPLYVHWSYLFI